MTDRDIQKRKRSARAHTAGVVATAVSALLLLAGIILVGSDGQTKAFSDGIGAALAALGIIGALSAYPLIRLNIWISDRHDARENSSQIRIGGWLSLIAVLLYLTPIGFILSLRDLLQRYNTLGAIGSIEGVSFIVENTISTVLYLLFPLFLIPLMHQRSIKFPILFSIYSTIPLLIAVIFTLTAPLLSYIFRDSLSAFDHTDQLDGPIWLNLLITCVLIAYMLRSKRVQRTFGLSGPPSIKDIWR